MRKIMRILLIVTMFFAQTQVTSVFAQQHPSSITGDSNRFDMQDQEDNSNNTGQVEKDVSNAIESNEESDQNLIGEVGMELAYLKIQNKQLEPGQQQEIEIGVENVGFIASSAQLTIKNLGDGSLIKVNSIEAIENLFTFEVEHQVELDTTLQLISIVMENDGSKNELSLSLNDLNFTYKVSVIAASDRSIEEELPDLTVINRGNSLEPNVGLFTDAIDETVPLVDHSLRSLEKSQRVTIVLDPGHGGNDPGAVANGLVEKELNWKISNYTKAYLEQYGVNVHLTRTEHQNPSLEARAQMAANLGANILVSQHVNAGGGTGVEVYVSKNAEHNASSTVLANMIADNLASLGLNNRGVKTRLYNDGAVYNVNTNPDYYGIIRHSVARGFPAIIVEHGFIDHPGDAAFLSIESNLKAMGEADAKALVKYYGLRKPITLTGEGYPTPSNLTATGFNIKYGTHVSSLGWQPWKEQGQTSGTTGQSLGIEGLRVGLVNMPNNNITLSARTYVNGYGWASYDNVTEGTLLGTTGQSAGISGISFSLKGTNDYYLLYRAHVQGIGWTDWTEADILGNPNTTRIEAIEMKIVPNETDLRMEGHISTVGWQYADRNGVIGTIGRSLRLEGFRISLRDQEYSGDIEYRAHVQSIGWQNAVKNGETSGTVGESRRVEAIQINLTGDMKDNYDVYYRGHAERYGWLGWTKNGDEAGTSGYGLRLEAIEVRLVPKNGTAPTSNIVPYLSNSIVSRAHVQDDGWLGAVKEGALIGTVNQSKRLEAIQMQLSDNPYSGGIRYRSHVQTNGWETNWSTNYQISGTHSQLKRLEAIQIELTGDMEKYYDVYYRVHVQEFGWLNWTKNGNYAGTSGYSYRMEAIEVILYPKGHQGPGGSGAAFHSK